jgi:glycosyltransferase involved in cell wall biosynthesis
MRNKKIAIIIPRYGSSSLGGAENLAKIIARHLSEAYHVDVLTTCATDYLTWDNDLPEGETLDGCTVVKRFIVDKPRSRYFQLYDYRFMRKLPHIPGMEALWMRMQGPCSSGLIEYIKEHKDNYDAFLFITYMYATTYDGLKQVADKSILIPAAHDDPYIRFRIYCDTFHRVRKLIYLTDEEKQLVDSLFDLPYDRGEVLGMPVDKCEGSPEQFRIKYGINGDFLLYVGRIDEEKGVGKLIDLYNRYTNERQATIRLILCGTGPMKVEKSERIMTLGYVPDEDKYGAIRAAIAVVQPSRYESYSISTIESMQCGTPVIVNGECNVLKAHCEKSGAGFSYTSYGEFKSILDSVLSDSTLRKRMGTAGMAYVKDHYSADAIGRKYISTIDGLVDRK